jgi:hypothetical protein
MFSSHETTRNTTIQNPQKHLSFMEFFLGFIFEGK